MQGRPELIVGIGNSGRSDDGLGWAFLDALRLINTDSQLEYRYQLNVEDAEMISRYSSVLFVDSSVHDDLQDYRITKLLPVSSSSFTSHSLDPGTVLHLADQLYGRRPAAFLLEIKGLEWGLREAISMQARANLDAAVQDFTDWYRSV
jgi:hydrogenase maturation protease